MPPPSSASSAAPATPAARTVYSDRFIPSRTGSNLALFDLAPAPSSSASGSAAPPSPYCALLRAALFGPDMPDRLASSARDSSSSAASPVGYCFCQVLDVPALQDDFYLNLVDWSSHNVLSVGLGNCVYLWNACSSKVSMSSSHDFFSEN